MLFVVTSAFLLVSSFQLSHAQSCYYPDGSLALNDTPCSTDGVTSCCGYGFACLENGVCQTTELALKSNPGLNENINYFRGSCTDQTWTGSECPKFCIGSQYANDGGNSMGYCSSDTFCCYGGPCDCASGTNVTVFDKSAVAITTIGVPGSGTTITSSSSLSVVETSTSISSAIITDISTTSNDPTSGSTTAASETASSSPTPTASPSEGGLSTGAKAGIGVGVALGVVFLVVIGLLIWRTNRQHKELDQLRGQRAPLQPNMQDHHEQPSGMSGPSELSPSGVPKWLQHPSPANGRYHTGTNSTSTPSNPSELHE